MKMKVWIVGERQVWNVCTLFHHSKMHCLLESAFPMRRQNRWIPNKENMYENIHSVSAQLNTHLFEHWCFQLSTTTENARHRWVGNFALFPIQTIIDRFEPNEDANKMHLNWKIIGNQFTNILRPKIGAIFIEWNDNVYWPFDWSWLENFNYWLANNGPSTKLQLSNLFVEGIWWWICDKIFALWNKMFETFNR